MGCENVTINICNCGCCSNCGGSTGTDTPFDIANPELIIDASDGTPPEGYSVDPLTLADRQCRVAIWLYDWVQQSCNFLGTSEIGKLVVSAIRSGTIRTLASTTITRWAGSIVASVLAALGTGGLGFDDFIVAPATFIVANSIALAISRLTVGAITAAQFEAAAIDIESKKQQIICKLSAATTSTQAKSIISTALSDAGVDTGVTDVLGAIIAPQLVTLLWYTADWWPSFETDYLANISPDCCGAYSVGEPITINSDQRCEAATFIVDQLIETFDRAGVAGFTLFNDLDIFTSTVDAYYNTLMGRDILTRKLSETASTQLFIRKLAEHAYENSYGLFNLLGFIPSPYNLKEYSEQGALDPSDVWDWLNISAQDPGDYFLASKLTQNRATLITGLLDKASAAAAYTYLKTEFTSYITTIVDNYDASGGYNGGLGFTVNTAATIKDIMGQAVDALIKPGQSTFLNLLFTQDSDLLGYGCGSGAASGNTPPPDGLIWYPTGTNTCEPVSTGNCTNGDGEPDGLFTDAIGVGYHQVEFSSVTITANTTAAAYYRRNSGADGTLYIDAKIDGVWVRARTSVYQNGGAGKWEPTALANAGGVDRVGATLTGLRFGFASSRAGHTWSVGGYSVQNYSTGV